MTAPFLSAQEATQQALAAVEAGDLDRLAQALAGRQQALRTASPEELAASPASRAASPEELAAALADGVVLALRLAQLKRNLAAEHGRLEQLRGGLTHYSGSSRSSGCIDVRG